MINVAGVLIDPTGTPLPAHIIRITDTEEIFSLEETNNLGEYSFVLTSGSYKLEVLFNNRYLMAGDLIVNDGTPSPISLTDLIDYSNPIDINSIEYPTYWQNLVDAIDNGTFTRTRVKRDQMADTLVNVSKVDTTSVSDDELERKGTSVRDLQSCSSQVTTEDLVYSDDEDNYLASKASTVKTKDLSSQESTIVNNEISKTSTQLSLYGTSTHTITMSPSDYEETKKLLVGTDSVVTSNKLNSKSFISTINGKVTSDTHTNTGSVSNKEIIVDNFVIGRDGNNTFEVDTLTDTVYIRGAMRVDDIQDADGNPIDVNDGDTIFQVFQFSDSISGPWHDELLSSDFYRRENYSVNGYIDPVNWSIGYQFRPIDEKGDSGDTIYIEYQYSPDGSSNWTNEMKAGDAFRRERTVVNSVAGAWSNPARIKGDNGDEIEIRSQYSIDGIYDWHDILVNGDMYERRARFVNGVQDSPWSDPFKIVGEDGVGIPGLNGSGWYSIVDPVKSLNFPSDVIATSDFLVNFGRVPQLDDHLFYIDQDPDPTSTTGRRCITPVGDGAPQWNNPRAYFDGDVIVKGTLSADRIVSNSLTGNEINSQTTIIAGSGSTVAGMNGYDLPTLPDWLGGGSNIYSDWRLWSGATDPNNAPFRVDKNGKVYASNIDISGSVTGDLTIGTQGDIKGGQTDYNTGTGFFLGYSGGDYKFSLGDQTSYIKWTGTTLDIKGSIAFGEYITSNSEVLLEAPTERSTINFNDFVLLKSFRLNTIGEVKLNFKVRVDAESIQDLISNAQFKIEWGSSDIIENFPYNTAITNVSKNITLNNNLTVLNIYIKAPEVVQGGSSLGHNTYIQDVQILAENNTDEKVLIN